MTVRGRTGAAARGAARLPGAVFGAPGTARSRQAREDAAVARLRDAGVRWVARLQRTRDLDGYPAGAPDGWLFVPRPNRYGDQLVGVVAFHPDTGLYHCHYWRFEADVDGRGRRSIDLPRFLGRHPELTGHRAHLYTGGDGDAVLCLSQRVLGGMPDLPTALVQTLKWADGTGEVVRGRPFPYR